MRLQVFVLIAALAVPFLFAPDARAERAPATMGEDPRVRKVTYSNSDVIRVDTHLRVNSAIEFGPGERISQVLLGDSEAFEVEVLSNRNTISVKPVIARAETNMTVYTSRRAVSFVLSEGRVRTATYRVVITFPDDRPRRTKVSSGTRDSGYQFAGEASFRPTRVWNDGKNTYFELRGEARPSVFAINGHGLETTTNSVTRGSVVRVSGIRSEYSVRIGDEVVCIRRIEGGVTSDLAAVRLMSEKEF